MNARDEASALRVFVGSLPIMARYWAREAWGWLDRAWPAILLGLMLGILAGVSGTRAQALSCVTAPDAETAQLACPDWLR